MSLNKKFITLHIDKSVIKEFKIRMIQLEISNQSKLTEDLMKKWLLESKDVNGKHTKSNL